MTEERNDDWNEWHLLDYWRTPTSDDVREFERRARPLELSAWEIALLESIGYEHGQVDSQEELARAAFGDFLARDTQKARNAIDRCFEEGWIQFLTAEFLSEMKAELDVAGYLTARGLIGESDHEDQASLVGRISFTRLGVALYHTWLEFDPATRGHWAYRSYDVVDEHVTTGEIYGTSIEECLLPLNGYENLHPLRAAEPIGRWCDRWWNRFQGGFRVRFETHRH